MNERIGFRRLTMGLAILFVAASAAVAAAEDQAAELYRQAEEALSEEDYRQAAAKFMDVFLEHRSSAYAEDALYWHAFALYRIGRTEDLHGAAEALKLQQNQYPDAAIYGDAAGLLARIKGELAKRGDADARHWVERRTFEFEFQDDTGWDETWDPPQAPPLPGFDPPGPLRNTTHRDLERENDVRIAALSALAQMDPGRALPVIRKVLGRRDDDSAALRTQAVFLLTRLDAPEAGEILIDTAKNDPSRRVRADALLGLSSVSDDASVDTIEEVVRTSGDLEIQQMAVVALHHSPHPRAVNLLRQFAADDTLPVETRAAAVRALAERRSSEDLVLLQGLYDSSAAESLKDHLILAIGRYRTEASRRWLLERVRDEREPASFREMALGMMVDDREILTRDLVEVYDTVPNRGIRRTAIRVLSRKKDSTAIAKLLEIARDERDDELRLEAILALSHSDDPRAVEILENIIGE